MKVSEFIKKYRIISIFVLLLNVYFLVTEIINFSQTKSGMSLFAILMYSSTIVYLLLLELFRALKKSAYYAFLFTFFYLFFNAVLNPFVIFFGKAGGLSSMYSLASFVPGFVAVIAYLIYLVVRIVSSLLKSFLSLIKRDMYARCRYFSIIVSNIFTIMVFVLNLIVTLFSTIGGHSFYDESGAHAFDMSGAGIFFFVGFYIPVLILSFIFSIHCIIGMIITKANMKRKKRQMELEKKKQEQQELQ